MNCTAPEKTRARPLSLAVLVLACLALRPAGAQQRPAWWDGSWRRRTLISVPADAEFRWAPAAYVWLHMPAGYDRGGADIRVVDPDGRPVPFGILHATPEGRCLVQFEYRKKDGTYAVYWDNPLALGTEQQTPEWGLVYETRPIPEGAEVKTWADARATIERSGPPFGADIWGRIFDAYNPWGPQSKYIGIYRGWLRAPRDGTYSFAVLSEHSAFLLIDGRPVVEWVGAHNIHQGQRGEKSAQIDLSEGMHKILYVHFSFGSNARAALAWMPPGEDPDSTEPPKFEIVWDAFFPRPAAARVFETEVLGRPLSADFTVSPEAYCEAGDAQMVMARFFSTSSTSGDSLIERYLWDFGDGQAAAVSSPRHVFLAPGVYDVQLSVLSTAGDRTSITKRVKAEPIREDMDFTRRKLNRFWDLTRGYRLDTLPTEPLLGLWEFAEDMEKEREAFEAALELDRRREQLEPGRVYEVAMALARCYHELQPDPDKAEQYLELALESTTLGQRQRRLEARFALCDHILYYRDDPERARQEYVRLRADFPQTDPAKRRLALIRIGDTWRFQGKLDEARNAYAEAEADPAFVAEQPKALAAGVTVHEVESYMLRGLGEEALDELEQLLWHFPTMRLEGEPALLRVKAALIAGNFEEAKKQADIYIGFAKDPNYLPAVHVGAAEACIELGLIDEAIAHYEKVLDDFPEAPQVRDAEEGLRRLDR